MHKSVLCPYFVYNMLSSVVQSHFRKYLIQVGKVQKRAAKTIEGAVWLPCEEPFEHVGSLKGRKDTLRASYCGYL